MTSELTDKDRIDWLEERARRSSTGISFDFVPSGERGGFRFMRRFFIGEPRRDLRSAIDAAMNPVDATVAGLEWREAGNG